MNSSCDKIFPLLNEYVDNNIDSESKKVVETHLQECLNCKNDLDQIKFTIDQLKILKNIGFEDNKDYLSASIIKKIEQDIPHKSFKLQSNMKYIASSLLVIALSMFIFFWHQQNKLESNVDRSDEHLLADYANDYYSILQSKDASFYSYDLDTFSIDGK